MGVSHYYPSNLTKGARCRRAGVLSLPGYFYFPSLGKKTPAPGSWPIVKPFYRQKSWRNEPTRARMAMTLSPLAGRCGDALSEVVCGVPQPWLDIQRRLPGSACGYISNVQDGCVLHADPGAPLSVGSGVTVGHNATLHGCRQPRFHGPPSRPGAGSPLSHWIHPPDG